jgi:periplasmic protein TonB
MSSLGMQYAYNQRDPSGRVKGIAIVVLVHAVIGYVLVTGMARTGLNILKKPLEAVVVQEVVIPPPPPPPPPKQVEKVTDAPKVDAPPPFVPPPDTAPPPTTTAPTIAATAAPPPVPAVIAPPPPSPPDNTKALITSLENEYAIMVRAMLNSTKRYPTGRKASQERPQGKVKVWFTVMRNGTLVDAGVLQSSDSNLLDDAALATVRRGTYPAFPPNTWVGEDQHRFVAEIEFNPPSS